MSAFWCLTTACLLATGISALPIGAQISPDDKLDYPPTHKGEQRDDYHGVKVADPYRWLEEGETPETHAWIEAQNKLTYAYLNAIPGRERIEKRLTQLWNYEKYGLPFKEGGRYFYTRNNGLQNQNVLYVTENLNSTPRILLDPNALSKDGTIAVSDYSVSQDGQYLAYSLSSGGSDWKEWHVRQVENGKDLPDILKWAKFSGAAWTHDNKGFFYSRFEAPKQGEELQQANLGPQIYYHRLGTPQSEDTLVYERPDHKDWYLYGHVTNDGHYLLIVANKGTERKTRLFFKDLTTPDAPVKPLLDKADALYAFLDNDGPLFWFQTDNNAPRGRVITIDIRQPEPDHWKEVIPQAAETLQSVSVVGDHLLAAYLKDACTQVSAFDLNGKLVRQVALPGIGTAGGFEGKRTDAETFYAFVSYTSPAVIYRYNAASGESTVFRKAQVAFNPENYETRQTFYTSKDGTRIPLFLTYRKGIKLDGKNPTYLYGYGGFRSAMTPAFSVSSLVWMEMGGVYAVACLRGGGEYGEAWHEAGTKLKKQNVFDDFIAAAEWLVAQKYTSPDKLAIGGGSNGGLLVGACMTQRPELFGAALPAVGVMDMLRFHKFTVGWGWISDYGSPDNPQEFKAIYAYSPLHNLKPGTAYPATLITTGDHDDRVVPAHSFKFAAALQAAHKGKAPVLIRIETRAGHGAGKPTAKVIEEITDRWAFLTAALKITLPTDFGLNTGPALPSPTVP